jgi:hypothetical protein
MKGWKLCVKWKDGTTTWEPSSVLKESNPVEVAQYAVSNKIDDEPAFAWWVPFTLKKQESIISALNKRYWKRTHKFGIRLPHTVEEALEIDKENNNDLWERSLPVRCKERELSHHLDIRRLTVMSCSISK